MSWFSLLCNKKEERSPRRCSKGPFCPDCLHADKTCRSGERRVGLDWVGRGGGRGGGAQEDRASATTCHSLNARLQLHTVHSHPLLNAHRHTPSLKVLSNAQRTPPHLCFEGREGRLRALALVTSQQVQQDGHVQLLLTVTHPHEDLGMHTAAAASAHNDSHCMQAAHNWSVVRRG